MIELPPFPGGTTGALVILAWIGFIAAGLYIATHWPIDRR